MGKDNVLIGILVEDCYQVSFNELCAHYKISEPLLIEMLEQGLLDKPSTDLKQLNLDLKDIQRIESAFRLHKDLGINMPGVTLVLELLDKLDQMHQELEILRRHF